MKKEISLNEFIEEFKEMGRDYYSHNGYEELFNYYDEFEDFDLDVIAICCDVNEYDMDELIENYGYLLEQDELDDEDYLNELVKYVERRTSLRRLNNGSYLVWCF